MMVSEGVPNPEYCVKIRPLGSLTSILQLLIALRSSTFIVMMHSSSIPSLSGEKGVGDVSKSTFGAETSRMISGV